jgi:amino acid adenylation domain-containing protein
MNLHLSFAASAAQHAAAVAVEEPSGASVTYEQLDLLSCSVRDRLVQQGVQPGDRVGLYMRKTIDTVAALLGVLRAGAAYVPVDPTAPAGRNAYILDNCKVATAIIESRFEEGLRRELDALGRVPPLLVLGEAGGGAGLRGLLEGLDAGARAPQVPDRVVPMTSLAYILYTSGSTGKPKGVMLTHENAMSFVDWCVRVFEPVPSDVFSSHAPFHFDLSILDLYTPLTTGARLALVSEEIGKEPIALAELIASKRITVWYSAPSILGMLCQFGKLETRDYGALRTVLFAGEVFPVRHLRSLSACWTHPRYFNLYGPTETNVCTYHEVVLPVPPERDEPYPIGVVCDHLEGVVVDSDGRAVAQGGEGELCIKGGNVLSGFCDEGGGVLRFVGRRDRMVKKRGFRVELGEIENALYAHGDVKEAAVVAMQDAETGVTIVAHLSMKSDQKVSLIALKKFCSERLPLYMIPDRFNFHAELPKTSTDKIDYQGLKKLG